MFSFESEVYDDKANILVVNLSRFRVDKDGCITEQYLKELDQELVDMKQFNFVIYLEDVKDPI